MRSLGRRRGLIMSRAHSFFFFSFFLSGGEGGSRGCSCLVRMLCLYHAVFFSRNTLKPNYIHTIYYQE